MNVRGGGTEYPGQSPTGGRLGWCVRVWSGGSRVEVRPPPGAPLTVGHPRPHRAGRVPQASPGSRGRGRTAGLSRRSGKRLLDTLGTLPRNARPVCVGLSWPDVFSPAPADWRRALSKLSKRLARALPDVGIVYVLETKRRRSGRSAGLEAPHVHALLYARPGSPAFSLGPLRAFLADAWTGCLGEPARIYAGPARSPIGARLYLVGRRKRLTPERRAAILAAYPDGLGTCWGVWNADALPTVEPVEVEVTEAEAADVRAAVGASASARSREAGHGGWIDPRWRSLSDPRPERWARRVRRRRSRRQRAERGPVCLHSVSTRDGAGLETKRKRPRIGVSASHGPLSGRGAKRIRTAGLCSAIAALYQLSYSPRPSG